MQTLQNKLSVTAAIVSGETGLSGNAITDLFHRDQPEIIAVLPEKRGSGKARHFTPLQFALVALMADLVAAEFKLPLAGKIAHRVMEAHNREPNVEQWAIVHTTNGNISTLPYTKASLETGYISGARITFAITVDLKNYADRIERAIAEAPKVIGGDDDD